MKESILCNKRLLAVDDEPDVLEALEEQLEDYDGLVLDKATNYDTGYHLIRSWSYDLVILDIMGVRGFDLLNAAVALGFPTVMLTAHALSPESLKKSIQLGARAFIPKERIGDISTFLEDVLSLGPARGWERVFERLGGFFKRKFGPRWQEGERAFWEDIQAGRGPSTPVILKEQ